MRTHNKVTSNARYPDRHWKDRTLCQKRHHKDHYARVTLWKDGVEYTKLVHRLVAEAFVPTDDESLTVNHIDGDKFNNRVENLEWMSLPDNIRHGFNSGLYSYLIRCVLVGASGERYTFDSLASASRFIGRNDGYVSGKIKSNQKITSRDGIVYRAVLEGKTA